MEKKEITLAYWKTEDLELVLHWKTWKELAFFRCIMHLKWLLLLLSKMLVLYWVNLQFARCGLGIVVSHTFGRETQFESKKLALECNTTLTTRPMHVNACYLISKTTKTTKTKRLNDIEQIDYNLQNKTTNMTKTKPVQPLRWVEDYRGSSALKNIV